MIENIICFSLNLSNKFLLLILNSIMCEIAFWKNTNLNNVEISYDKINSKFSL
jgi:hypothetical protein